MKNRFTTISDQRPATSDKSRKVLSFGTIASHESSECRRPLPSLVACRLSLVAGPRGFTLVEMLIVVALISLLAMIAVPSFIGMFSAGAESQAYNAVSALLNSARAHALKTNNYVAVHFQPADPAGAAKSDNGYAAILEYDPKSKTFKTPLLKYDQNSDTYVIVPTTSFVPAALPAGVGVGQLSDDYIGGDTYKSGMFDDDTAMRKFMTFTVVFSPQGTVVLKVNGENVKFDTGVGSYFYGDGTSKLWEPDSGTLGYDIQNNAGVRAITIFSRTKTEPLDGTGRQSYLNTSAPFLPVNSYTGQLFPR